MDNQPNDKISETLAVNTGNMIASLNVQIAKLQVAHEQQEKQIKLLKDEKDQLKIENLALKKEVKKYEPKSNSSDNKQISKQRG